MQRKSLGYTLIILMFGIFGLIIYGAYSPARKSQKQQIVCVKFKNDVKTEVVNQYMRDFAGLRHEIPQIVSYSAGTTLKDNGQRPEYDVMNYLTFQSEADIEMYKQTQEYRLFAKKYASDIEKMFVINADIR
ncbi:Dabb family protein [Tellurirhabdus rosea]|uniref:Dabb family protein n=1 Tax=Tellurirhabdus rosea TaxID=2674997 RepID=UPI002254FF05|nr:Dabb family protein [Tellurirhabdus rosea]